MLSKLCQILMLTNTNYADAQCPPSTLRSAPVIHELPSASKKTAGALKSSGTPSLPSKAPAIHVFSTSGSASRSASVIAVRMYCKLSVTCECDMLDEKAYPWRQCVHSDAMSPPFLSNRPAHLLYSCLGSIVSRTRQALQLSVRTF